MDVVEGFDPIRILAALQVHGVRAVVVGGVAALAHGADTITDDVDICVEGSDDNLDRLAFTLAQLGATSVATTISGDAPKETFDTICGRLDCIELEAGRFIELDATATTVEVEHGVRARVAALDSLQQLKRHSGDLMDSVRIGALGNETHVAASSADGEELQIRYLDERDEYSRDDDPPTRTRDKVWKALEDVDKFLTKIVDR